MSLPVKQAWQKTSMSEHGASEKEIYRWWKQGQATWKGYKDIAHSCRNGAKKAKAQVEPTLAKEVKGSTKGFFKYVVGRRKVRDGVGHGVGLLLSGAGDLVTRAKKKAKVISPFFPLSFHW